MLPGVSGLPAPGSTALWTLSGTGICFLFSWKKNKSLGPAAAFWANWERQQEIKMRDTKFTTCKKGKSPLLWQFHLLTPTWCTVSLLFPDSDVRHLSLSLWGVALLLSSQVGDAVSLAHGLWSQMAAWPCSCLRLSAVFSTQQSLQLPYHLLLPPPCTYYLTFPFRSNGINLSSWLPGSIPINPCQQLRSM